MPNHDVSLEVRGDVLRTGRCVEGSMSSVQAVAAAAKRSRGLMCLLAIAFVLMAVNASGAAEPQPRSVPAIGHPDPPSPIVTGTQAPRRDFSQSGEPGVREADIW